MKKTKVLIILFLILWMSLIPFSYVNAHSVDIDPQGLISFPFMISNGKGNITIEKTQTEYSLYYQAIEMSNTDYEKMNTIQADGQKVVDAFKTELDKLKAEFTDLQNIKNDAFNAWNEKKQNGASTEEIEAAKIAYEAAKENYTAKVEEYDNKVAEYKDKVKEINQNINSCIPSYVESNWIKTENGDFAVDLTQFSGKKAFVVWAKLVASDGTITYDESIYTMTGNKVDEIAVKSVSLNKTSLTITEGNSYQLIATITPSDATSRSVTWSSDNEAVAKVNNGNVSALSTGTATITATTVDGNYTATCKVTVVKKGTSDTTVANNKLPRAGSMTYVIIAIAIVVLSIIGIVTYKKVKNLNFK